MNEEEGVRDGKGRDEEGRGEQDRDEADSALADAEDHDRGASSFPALDERRYSRALQGGLAILACFTAERPVLGTTEIAEMLGMSVATASRFVLTLAEEGYLEREVSRKYRLTLRATELGMASINETGLCMHARPHLQELALRSGCTVALGVLDGPEVLLLDRVRATRRGRGPKEGRQPALSRLPLHCTAIGKALLAGLPADWRSRLVADIDLDERGPRTVSSREMLARQLARVPQDGFAVQDEELCAGACAIAAPVREESGDTIAAVGVVARDYAMELQEMNDRFAGPLLEAAERISARAGWRGAGE